MCLIARSTRALVASWPEAICLVPITASFIWLPSMLSPVNKTKSGCRTSQALFIHRNTLLYRLNQIRDLLGRDIDDALVRLELLSSIVAKDYLGE
mgnify:CR=1 FL=1